MEDKRHGYKPSEIKSPYPALRRHLNSLKPIIDDLLYPMEEAGALIDDDVAALIAWFDAFHDLLR